MAPLVKTGQSVLPRPLFSISKLLMAWQVRRATRADLARLDPHLLDDIGLSARARDAECDKAFWED
jgi:uncharacterized protein YjiS (DUF1127 family)